MKTRNILIGVALAGAGVYFAFKKGLFKKKTKETIVDDVAKTFVDNSANVPTTTTTNATTTTNSTVTNADIKTQQIATDVANKVVAEAKKIKNYQFSVGNKNSLPYITAQIQLYLGIASDGVFGKQTYGAIRGKVKELYKIHKNKDLGRIYSLTYEQMKKIYSYDFAKSLRSLFSFYGGMKW